MPRKMLDLFSGLGGASQAFIDQGWEVHRLENNLLLTDPTSKYFVPGTTHQDINNWPFLDLPRGYYDFIWASPPCTEFSDAMHSPKSKAARAGIEFFPDLTLAKKTKEVIEYFDPPYYCVENVRGSRKEFTKIFGPPWQIMFPFFFYGRFPRIKIAGFKHTKDSHDKGSRHPLRANYRGKIPYEISQAFCIELMYQTRIEDWIK
jgi:hypothetical protein